MNERGASIMQLLGYSERGFINAFFYEVFRHPNPTGIIRAFFALAHWPLMNSRLSVAEAVSVDTILIEQSFSDFGDADVLILASCPHEKVAFFCEAKRGKPWRVKKEWEQFKARFQASLPGGVSNVFRQLYLKQRLAQSFVVGDDLGTGIEFDGVLRTTRGDHRRKIGKNKVVLKAVEMLKPYVGSAYYLILTPEPWRDEVTTLFQAVQSFSPPPMASPLGDSKPRAWDVSRWGIISLQDVVQLCKDRHLNHAVEVADFNEGQLY
jgi:hypothetical protein